MAFLAASALLVAPAAAEDLQPPPWRGEYSTTSQVWEFNDSAIVVPGTAMPPDGPAPGGEPPLASTEVIWEPGPAPWDYWREEYEPFQYDVGGVTGEVGVGVIPLSGSIAVTVDNHNPPNEVKLVWVQLTWCPQDAGEEPIFIDLFPEPVDPPMIVEEIPLGPLWRETTYTWEVRPNPPDEFFVIEGTINVDELVIDTWCIPEPAMMSLLALGGLGLLSRRRRR